MKKNPDNCEGAVIKAYCRTGIMKYDGKKDNIPAQPVENPGQEQWRAALAMARIWTDTVNILGGDVILIHLPEIGIKGNTQQIFLNIA